MFYLFTIFCIFYTPNVNTWEGYHSIFDDELPPISWKECGISLKNCDPNSTFKDPFISSRIFGGEYASSGEYPWYTFVNMYHTTNESGQVALLESGCGGAIINEWWILTAAHCALAKTFRYNQSFVVSMGALNRYGGLIFDVERVVIHSSYFQKIHYVMKLIDSSNRLRQLISKSSLTDENQTIISQLINEYKVVRNELNARNESRWNWDIALFKVKNRIVPLFNETHYRINSICLPKTGITNTKNETAVFMGIGLKERFGTEMSDLKKGMTVIMDNNFCAKGLLIRFKEFNTKDMICYKYLKTGNSLALNSIQCNGDSGSPMIQYKDCRGLQIGVISWHEQDEPGQGCYPEFYNWVVRVSSFMPWIHSVTQNNVIVISETNNSLIVSVITTTIIAVILSFLLIWIMFLC